MHEGPPQNDLENTEDTLKQEKIALSLELAENMESFPFPGIKPDSYTKIKAEEEEFPGYSTPIDELLKRFESEGMKVVLGKYPSSGNVFMLPQGSDDIINDNLFPRHLVEKEDMDERLLDLIIKDS